MKMIVAVDSQWAIGYKGKLLNHCNTVYVTKIYYKYKNVDRFFPNLDNAIRWECKILDKLKVPFGKDYINRITFNKYTRR